jgi:hypothetical protein
MYVDLEKPNDGPNSWNFLRPGFLKNGWTVVKEGQGGRQSILDIAETGPQ